MTDKNLSVNSKRRDGEQGGRGRPGLLPPLGVDFETALGALLKTPPPPKGEATDKPKRKARARRARK